MYPNFSSAKKCLTMCGLDAFADAMVGSLGVEQRKRTTIGVELAAKVSVVGLMSRSCGKNNLQPQLLLFLDEPTSGLDSQSAWAIMAFLRSLADNGQSILFTWVPNYPTMLDFSFLYSIHQVTLISISIYYALTVANTGPSLLQSFSRWGLVFACSADLNSYLQGFDRLLLLRKGGQTVYFGDIGEGAQSIISYFETAGARKCRPEENPYVSIYYLLGSIIISLIINSGRNTCLTLSGQERQLSQKEIGVKYGSILRSAKFWKKKSINFTKNDDHIRQSQQVLRPSLQLHGLTKLVPYFNGKTWLIGATLCTLCQNCF